MEKVAVLMSTYNGESFIVQQIDSILSQRDVDVDLIIRDDGSTDSTVEKIKLLNDSRIKIIQGENIGWKSSFSWLLRNVQGYEYYAFSDQDDVWNPMKLKVAIDSIGISDFPCLYYCDATIVDKDLNKIGIKKNYNPFQEKLTNIFICSGQGCCIVLNKSTKKLFDAYIPKYDFSHEAWLCIICGYFGKIIHDNNSYMMYRVTGQNTSGFGRTGKMELIRKRKDKKFLQQIYPPYATELLSGFNNNLSVSEKKELLRVANYKKNLVNKLWMLFEKRIHRQTLFGTIGLKIAILLNRY